MLELLKGGTKVTLIVRNKNRVMSEILEDSNAEIIEKEISLLSSDDFVDREYDFFSTWDGKEYRRKKMK